jgi:tetratricopeptide (TPR) repeat protein
MMTGRLAESESAYRECLAVSEKLTTDFPNAPDYKQTLAFGLHNLGELLLKTDRLPEAESVYQRAQDIFEKLAGELPGNPDYRRFVGDNLGRLGLVLLDSGRIGEAEALMRQSLASAEKLVTEPPDAEAYRKALAAPHGNLGIVQYRRGDWKASVTSLGKWAELIGEPEADGDARFFLAMAQWQLGDKEQARTSFDQAVQWMDKKDRFNQRLGRFRAEAAGLLGVTDEPKSGKQPSPQ